MRWTKEDIEYITKEYQGVKPMKELIEQTGRSKTAISHKAVRLGLSRPRPASNRPKNKDHRRRYDLKYYEKHKKKLYEGKKKRELKYKLEMIKALGGKCTKCGYNKSIAALDFHHNGPEKEKEISVLLKWVSKQKILKEAKKCILLCANCHRELHYGGA